MAAQALNLVRIMPEELVPPSVVRFFAAILGDRPTDGFIRGRGLS